MPPIGGRNLYVVLTQKVHLIVEFYQITACEHNYAIFIRYSINQL